MKIGIFTNYEPAVALGSEGLGRYLGTLVRGFVENGDEVTIACPKWSEQTMKDLFKELSIDDSDIRIITTHNIPAIIRVYDLFSKKGKRKKTSIDIKKIAEDIALYYSKKDSMFEFVISTMLFIMLGLIGVVIIGLAMIFKKMLKLMPRKCVGVAKKVLKKLELIDEADRIKRLYFDAMKSHSAEELVKRINSMEKKDVWYVPSLFWPEVNKICNQNVVINVPDLITEDFATAFSGLSSPSQTKNCRKTLQDGRYFITYCDYIGNSLIEKSYGGFEKKWMTITHSNHDMSSYITIPNDFARQMNAKIDLTKKFAKNQIMQIYNDSIFGNTSQLVNGHFMFYASQFRPHKNVLNLIKAYEYLIRHKFRHERMVFTGNIKTLPDVEKYVEEHDLVNEIVFCHGVSTQKLAALYCCADLVVNPTLYEGGFPFTFGEGMSVGTPSIMSDIPQVRDVLEPAGLDEIMFDPRDYLAIAEKMEWALDNLEYLYNLETPLYQEMAKRTDAVVAKEYIAAFKEIVG